MSVQYSCVVSRRMLMAMHRRTVSVPASSVSYPYDW